MGALGGSLRLLLALENLSPPSRGDLLVNFLGSVRVCEGGGTALAAWGPHSALCRAGGQMAQARFLAGGGLRVPCRLLLGAPNLPLQLKTGLWWPSACGRAQFIGLRLV